MAKRGPKPRQVRPKRGRKAGTKVFQNQTWNSIAGTEEALPYDNSRAYELARAYIHQYKISPLAAARLAVGIEYANLVNAWNAFSCVVIHNPFSGQVETLTNEQQKALRRKFDALVTLSPKAKKDGIELRKIQPLDISQMLPRPHEPWIDKSHPMVRRITERIYGENRSKAAR